MTPDKADIATRLRQTRADMIGTDDEQHYWDCHEGAAEIERLRRWARLTDAEREAVRFCVTASLPETQKLGGVAGELCRMHAATLRGLLERLSGTGDCPAADNAAKQDTTGARNGTPGKCTVPAGCRETGGM